MKKSKEKCPFCDYAPIKRKLIFQILGDCSRRELYYLQRAKVIPNALAKPRGKIGRIQ